MLFKRIANTFFCCILCFVLILTSFVSVFASTTEEQVNNLDSKSVDIAETSAYLTTPIIYSVKNEDGYINISWNAVDGAYKYRVFYYNGTSWKKITDVESTSFIWKDAIPGTEYTFTVRCIDEELRYVSNYDSNGYKYYYLLDTPLVSNVYTDGDNVIVNWNKVNSAYKYRVFIKNGTSWKTIATVTGENCKWNGALYNNTYIFTVRCVDEYGKFVSDFDRNGYSYIHKINTPSISKVEPYGDGVLISINPSENAYKYKLFIKDGSSWKSIGSTLLNNFYWDGVKFNNTYIFTVRCIDSKGNFTSDFDRNGISFKYALDTPKINSYEQNGSNVTFKWNKVSGAKRYCFFVKTSTSWKKLGYSSSNSYTVVGAKYNEKNVYTVRCVNSTNEYISGYDSTGYTHTLKYDTPKITSVSSSLKTVTIKWNNVPGISKYRLFYKNNTSWSKIADVNGNSFEYTMSYGDTKTFTIRGIDDFGSFVSGFDSSGYTFTLHIETPKIKSVSATNIAGAAVNIEWPAVDGAIYYRLFYKNGTSWKTIDTTTGTSYTWYYVLPNTSYTYTIRCVDADGNFISSFDSTGYTYKLNTNYLQTPRVTNVSNNSDNTGVVINWTAVSGAAKYRIFYNEGDGWRKICDVSGTSYTYNELKYNVKYRYTVRCVSSSGDWMSYYDNTGVSYTLYSSNDVIILPLGKSINNSIQGVSNWKSSDSKIASVNSLGIITGVKIGNCQITGGGKNYKIAVVEAEPIRVAYTQPNCAEINEKVSLVAITDTTKTGVRFKVGSSYVEASSCVSDSYGTSKVFVWKANYTPTKNGKTDVKAYSKTSNSSWETCEDGNTEIFVMKDKDLTVCEERRASDAGIQFIATCEGLISEIEDDKIAPGNLTVGYGRVIYQGDTFYNNLSKSQAYGYLVQTVNKGTYTSKVNSTLIGYGTKFNQNHFDALVSLCYNCGAGVLSYSDVTKLIKQTDLSKATKTLVVNAFAPIHHAGGCIWGLLTRRIDECEMFLIGDYTRDYGSKNRCDIKYSCKSVSFP